MDDSSKPDSQIVEALQRGGLVAAGAPATWHRLTGGVSSDIWKVETDVRTICVKRALSQLKVEAEWFAPVERNRFEVAWYRIASDIAPGAAPRVLMQDEGAMLFAMEYLDPADHPLWKDELRSGRANRADAAAVARRLAAIHAGTADNETIAAQFPRTDIFKAIRLEPYLEAMAENHPDLAKQLQHLSRRTASVRRAMIHGDVSPKNILIGPAGPVFLDAECACIGDPAFDLAFCLNHLLLKCLWTPQARSGFLACFEAMASTYCAGVTWEDAAALEIRAASLLPALFLARVDGKSPVEYITREADRDSVRRVARPLVANPPTRLETVLDAWRAELVA